MRLAAYEQQSQPESNITILISGEPVMLEGNLAGKIFVQIAMWPVSETMTSNNVFTY
jgi:hypothetical protein